MQTIHAPQPLASLTAHIAGRKEPDDLAGIVRESDLPASLSVWLTTLTLQLVLVRRSGTEITNSL